MSTKFLSTIAFSSVLYFFSSTSFANEDRLEKYSDYIKAKDSLSKQEVIISCSDYTFKYESGFFGSEKAFIKSGLEWRELDNFETMDVGLSFLQYGDLNIGNIQYLSDSPEVLDIKGEPLNNLKDFLLVDHLSVGEPLYFEVDFYTMQLTIHNNEVIKVPVSINEEKYIANQKFIGAPAWDTGPPEELEKMRLEIELKIMEENKDDPYFETEPGRKKEIKKRIKEIDAMIDNHLAQMEERDEIAKRNTLKAKEVLSEHRSSKLQAVAMPGDLEWTYSCR